MASTRNLVVLGIFVTAVTVFFAYAFIIPNAFAPASFGKSDYLRYVRSEAGLTQAYSEYEICNPSDLDFATSKKSKDNFNWYFTIAKGRIKDSWFEIAENMKYSEIVYDNKQTCNPYVTANGTNIENCMTDSVPRQVERTATEWRRFDPAKFKYEAKKCYSIRVYISYDLAFNNPIRVDNVLEFAGYNYEEYAWLDANWLHRKKITATADAENHISDYFNINATGLTLATNNCTKELRLTDNSGTAEMDFIIVNGTGESLAAGNQWCVIGWNGTVPASTNTDFYIYYDNAAATKPTYQDEKIGFGNNNNWLRMNNTDGTMPETGTAWAMAGVGSILTHVVEDGKDMMKIATIAANSNWWKIATSVGALTMIFRMNTSSTIWNDQHIYVETGAKYETFAFLTTYVWAHDKNVIIGGIAGTKIQTYRLTLNTTDYEMKLWVYNQSDGSAALVGSGIIGVAGAGGQIAFGKTAGVGGGTNSYWDFIGYNLIGNFTPLALVLGGEEDPAAPDLPRYSNEVAAPASPQVYNSANTFNFSIGWSGAKNLTFEHNFTGLAATNITYGSGKIRNTSTTTYWINFTQTNMTTGNHTYRWFAWNSSGWNVTGAYMYNVTRATPTLSLTSSAGWNINYGYATTVTGSVTTGDSGATTHLYDNGTIHDEYNGAAVGYSGGAHNITYAYLQSENYTLSQTENVLTVNRTIVNITALPVTQTISYGSLLQYCTSNSTVYPCTQWRNNTNVSAANNTNVVLGVGGYGYVANITAPIQNYSWTANTSTITVNQASPSFTANLSYPTSNTTRINSTVTAGDNNANFTVYRNGTIYNSTLVASFPKTLYNTSDTNIFGVYNFTTFYNGSQNYSALKYENLSYVEGFSANDILSGEAISSFQVMIMETATLYSTTNGLLYINLGTIGNGSRTLRFIANGYNTTNYVEEFNTTTLINKTYSMVPASLKIQVYDESQAALGVWSNLTFNVTITNATASTTWYNQSNFFKRINETPTGEATIDLSSYGYQPRRYYVSITSDTANSFISYLLPTADALLVRFHIKTTAEVPIQNALVSAYRFFNTSWQVVGQQYSDVSGTAAIMLNPFATYRINVTATLYVSQLLTLQPSSADYSIYMQTTAGFETWDTGIGNITMVFLPTDTSLNNTNITFTCWVTSSDSKLEYVAFNLTHYNGTVLYNNLTATAVGTPITFTFNYTFENGTNSTAVCMFKKTGYNWYNATKKYYIYNMTGEGMTGAALKATEFAQFSLGLISIILSGLTAGFVTKFGRNGMAGAAAGLAVLAICTFYFNWFDWKVYMLLTTTIAALLVIRSGL